MTAPEAYVGWINEHLGFNPRAQANSNALADFVTADIRRLCPALDRAIASGAITITKNTNLHTKVAARNVDLVFQSAVKGGGILARLAVENKTIMTAHAKARWNRYGDIIAYSNHVHNHNPHCIAAALVVINQSVTYENPDAFAKGLKRPLFKMQKVVSDTVNIFARVPLRNSANEPNDQPEAIGVIVVDYDGVIPAKLVTGEPAPDSRTTVHYDSFIKRVSELCGKRLKRSL